MPEDCKVVGCVLGVHSVNGKKARFLKRAYETFYIFGISFFMHYSIRYLKNMFLNKDSLKDILKSKHIPLIDLKNPINHADSVNKIKSYKPDLLISILGNQIFRKPIIDLAPKGCINLHSSMLPKYRGLMPTFWVLKNKEKYTGVSVFLVDEGIDSGPIIVQEKILIGNCTLDELINLTKEIGMRCLLKAIDAIKREKIIFAKNDISIGSYYTYPNRRDVKEFLRQGNKFF